MNKVILQLPGSFETRAIRTAAMLSDNVLVINSTLESLKDHVQHLQDRALPVGSVEFVRQAMDVLQITEPANLSYPAAAIPYLQRKVVGTLCEHDQIQRAAFLATPPDAMVWVSEPVQWQSEWRYYVSGGQVIGKARYDEDGADNAAVPDLMVVQACMADIAIKHPYAIDFGVMSTGETALVEVNDAWAIGLYSRALEPRAYLEFLRSRWDSISSE